MDNTWLQIYFELDVDNRKLEWYALQKSWLATHYPHFSFDRRTDTDGTVDVLLRKQSQPEKIEIELDEKKTKGYCFHLRSGKEYFHDGSLHHEMDPRQPGTTAGSDLEDENDIVQYNSEQFAPITTIAGQYLTSITFAAPDTGNDAAKRCDLYPSYEMQLSVRTDDNRRYLYYDCFEYKPKWWKPDIDVLPSRRERKKLLNVIMRSDEYGYADSEDEKDKKYDAPVELEPCDDPVELKKRKMDVKLTAHAGAFMCSRLFRIQVPLSAVCGIRVHSPPLDDEDDVTGDEDWESDDEDEVQSVLILELEQPTSTFGVRCVSSDHRGDNDFSLIDDWTPGKVASRATRHYICGEREEINGIASHLAEISENNLFKCGAMEEEKPPKESKRRRTELVVQGENSLIDDRVDLSIDSAPAARNVSAGAQSVSKEKESKTLSEVDVHKMLKEECGVENAESVSNCLKRGILDGHIKLTHGKDTIVTTNKCLECDRVLTCTVGDILFQQDYGGSDYGDAGLEAPLQCPGTRYEEEDSNEDGCKDAYDCIGIYVTGMCNGRTRFDSGKAHNHCTECEGFGICLDDYREAHCHDCGGHWFAGVNCSFPCSQCGGGFGNGRKGKSLTEREPPDDSVWDGWVEGYTTADNKSWLEELSNTN